MAELFQLQIIAPNRIFYDSQVTMVEMTTGEGEIGVYAKHLPITTTLEPGIVRIHEKDGVREAAVHAGFVVILQDKVTLMAEVAEWPEEIDVNRAEEAKIRAERRLSSTEANLNIQRAELALRRSLVRIELSKHTK